jgi:hypothetical protein
VNFGLLACVLCVWLVPGEDNVRIWSLVIVANMEQGFVKVKFGEAPVAR